MNKKRLKIIWSIIEKFICYFALLCVIVNQLLSMLLPDIVSSLASNIALSALSAALIVIFQKVDFLSKKADETTDFSISESFDEGLKAVLKTSKRIDTLDILAHTSKTNVNTIIDSKVQIGTVRLLLCKPKIEDSRHYPTNTVAIKNLDLLRNYSVQQWLDLKEKGYITNLEIRYYEFDPTFHFAIINNKYVHYGLYKMENINSGYSLFTLYTVSAEESIRGEALLNDYIGFFNDVFDNWSYSNELNNENVS